MPGRLMARLRASPQWKRMQQKKWEAARQEFLTELNRPFRMDPRLEAFIKKVYIRDDLMLRTPAHFAATVGRPVPDPRRTAAPQYGTDALADKIYQLYQGEPRDTRWDVHKAGQAAAFIKDLWSKVEGHERLRRGWLQYSEKKEMAYYVGLATIDKKDDTNVMLRDLVTLYANKIGPTSDPQLLRDFEHLCKDFIYFIAEDSASAAGWCRVYANVKFERATRVVDFLVKMTTLAPGYIKHFKIVGPEYFFAGRIETVVIYAPSVDKARELAEVLVSHDFLRGCFNSEAVSMTEAVAPGVGVSIGAEPVYQATGMKSRPGKWEHMRDDVLSAPVWTPVDLWEAEDQKGQSFGTIRSEVIAMAVLNYNDNKGHPALAEGFETFQKFVAAAFRGYGLDPEAAAVNRGDT